MWLTRGNESALGGLAERGLARAQLPVMEAVPPEFVGGADLVGEPERVDPTLLFGAPAAVPCELDDPRLATTFDSDRANEIRAARPCVDLQMLDEPFRMGMEQLIDEPDHFDPRHATDERDRRSLGAGCERGDVSFESLGRARAREDFGVNRHGRNISGWHRALRAAGPVIKTKLTGGSARRVAGTNYPW